MAHLTQFLPELYERLVTVLGLDLDPKKIASIDVSLHLGYDEIVMMKVSYSEYADEDRQEQLTKVFECMELKEVEIEREAVTDEHGSTRSD